MSAVAAPELLVDEELLKIVGIRRETLLFDPLHARRIRPSGDEIRRVLRVAQLTNNEAGELLGVNARCVRRWTAGELLIAPDRWFRLVTALGLIRKPFKGVRT